MAGYQPLPPYVHHTTERLTHRQAHSMLSNFLSLAEINAAYRPDSTLSDRGPVSSSSSTSMNLTLHHLNRILQGIEGKRVGGSDDLEKFFDVDELGEGNERRKRRKVDDGAVNPDEDVPATPQQQQQNRRPRSSMNVHASPGEGAYVIPEHSEAEPDTPGGGWQDKEDFETEQKDDEVDAMNDDRRPGASLHQPRNEREVAEMVGVEIEATGEVVDPRPENGETQSTPVKPLDKEERKRRKQERRKEEKRKAAEQRSKPS